MDIVSLVSALGMLLRKKNSGKPKVVVGRDARISGAMIQNLVTGTLMGCGVDVVDLDLSTTPTVAMGVLFHQAQGGIVITASHNPKQWNALKILDQRGEFIDDASGQEIYQIANASDFDFARVDAIGIKIQDRQAIAKHIQAILDLDLVCVDAIRKASFSVALDAINSTGGIAVPMLLEALGIQKTFKVHCDPTGEFAHNPEPLEAHLKDILHQTKASGADVGFVVDPDVDRLAIVDERGVFFGEEYTLAACADYVLKHREGACVSNLSSSQVVQKVSHQRGQKHFMSAVGEVYVVAKMKEVGAVIGGEGNGGVIFPELHYGRDALVGIALFLSYMAREGIKASDMRKRYPDFFMSKGKVSLSSGVAVETLLDRIATEVTALGNATTYRIDGLKIVIGGEWVHIRASNTEPVLRIYTESSTSIGAERLLEKYTQLVLEFAQKSV